jgi:hypothetical protein
MIEYILVSGFAGIKVNLMFSFWWCEWKYRWSWKAIKAFTMAELEARKLKFATTGTEALLLGILIEGAFFLKKNIFLFICIVNFEPLAICCFVVILMFFFES